jgi:aspartate/methionine/tyrosine aminotransferase
MIYPLLSTFSTMWPSTLLRGASRCVSQKVLTEETMSQAVRNMEYAVRGEVVSAASRLQHEIAENPSSHPQIDHVLFTNVGNPHSVGQESLRWPRLVMALCNLPDELGIDHPDAYRIFPREVIDRAKEIKHISLEDQGTGAYSHSQGHFSFRQHISNFIEERDGGVPSNPDHIFMTNGASTGIDMILQTLLADETWCVFFVDAVLFV